MIKSSKNVLPDLFANLNTFVVTQYSYSNALEKDPLPQFISGPFEDNESLNETTKVSFITVVTDQQTASTAAICILSFLKCASINHELIVVDGFNFDKMVDLTSDSRIKVVKVTSKDNAQIPLGGALNIAVKNASNDVIFHLLPNNVYNLQNLNKLLNGFLNSCSDMFLSIDSLTYFVVGEKSVYQKSPSIANCIYYKRFWSVNHFSDIINDEIKLLHHFIKGRTLCVKTFPSIYNSFKLMTQSSELYNETPPLDLSLFDLLIPPINKALQLTLDEIKSTNKTQCLVE